MPPFRPTARPARLALRPAMALAAVLAGCSPMPDLGVAAATRGDLPPAMLLPLDQVLAEADAAARSQAGALGPLEARVAALRARAAALRRL